MLYLSIALGLLLAAQHVAYLRRLDRERATAVARETKLLEKHAELVDRITLLKVDPQQAAIVSYPEIEEQPHIPVDDSPYADAAWAEHMERTS